jgi:uncharacterized membrane protein YhfC
MQTQILYITHALNGLLMIALPVGLGFFLAWKFKLGWRLFWIGAAVFVLSQVGHIPFNTVVTLLFQRGLLPAPPPAWMMAFNAVFLGLSAGVFEEVARYLMYRYWTKDARWWGQALFLGTGHGGFEAIILGLLVLVNYVYLAAYGSAGAPGLSPAEAAAVQQYWSIPWGMSLVGAVERLFTLPMHIACSVLVLQVFRRRQLRWLGLAILWHALVDGVGAVWIARTYGIWAGEAILGVFALLNLAIIFALRQPPPQPVEAPEPAPLPIPAFVPAEVAETPEDLEKTRFQ